MKPKYYILDGKNIVMVEDITAWGEWFNTADRTVARTHIEGIMVSTVFLGLDHSWKLDGDPMLFESMVFLPDQHEGKMLRYFTWAEAEVGHNFLVQEIEKVVQNSNLLTIDVLTTIMQASKVS